MNKYVVALFDGEIKQELVEANSKFEALVSYLGLDQDELDYLDGSLDKLYENVANQDAYIDALELKHERTSRKGGGLQNQVAGFDSQARVQ